MTSSLHQLPLQPPSTSIPRDRTFRSGFTILELLVTMGMIGVIVALVLPAIASARESARKIQCVSQLKQVGIALHNYHDLFGCLSPGWQWESQHQSAYGWSVPLLPFLDQGAVLRETHRDLLLTDPANTLSRETVVSFFLCPSDITLPRFTLYEDDDFEDGEEETLVSMPAIMDLPVANYIGVFGNFEPDEFPTPLGDGAFIESRGIRFVEFTRGLGQTFVVGERTMARVPSTWLGVDFRGEDAACRLVGNTQTAPNCSTCDECEFDSRHPGGANFLWGDGHVSLVSNNVSAEEYQMFARRGN